MRDDLFVDADADAEDADAEAHVAALVAGGVDAGGNRRYRHSGEASVSKCCLLFASKGVRDWCDMVGVSVVVGIEQAVLQSFQSNNSFEKTWGKGW